MCMKHWLLVELIKSQSNISSFITTLLLDFIVCFFSAASPTRSKPALNFVPWTLSLQSQSHVSYRASLRGLQ